MGDKTIPDAAEHRLESRDFTFIAGIGLPHKDEVHCSDLAKAVIVG